MNKIQLRPYLAFFGNLLDHYSSAMFCLSTPLLITMFFPNISLCSNLIKAFSILPLTVFTKPLGAMFFSMLTQKKGAETSLKISYIGMAFISLTLGLMPLNINQNAFHLFLIITRLLQGFFSSGETINGAMYILNHTHEKQKGIASGFYDACSVAGYVLASFLIYYFQIHNLFTNYWRVLFLLGSLTVLPAFFFKKPSLTLHTTSHYSPSLLPALKIAFIAGLSYAFFSLCFLFTSFLAALFQNYEGPIITKQTTSLLIIDLILLPICGLISNKISYLKLMKIALIIASILVPFLLFLIPIMSLFHFFMMRLCFTILGALFSCGLFRFCKDTMPHHHQLVTLSMSFSLGSALIGQSFPLIATTLYKIFPSGLSIGLFFSCLCLLGIISLEKKSSKLANFI